jgi:hypothetical protein
MKRLTLKYAVDNGFTPIDCVKYFRPEWSDEECDFYLWNFTCFPMSIEDTIKQLNEKFITHEPTSSI